MVLLHTANPFKLPRIIVYHAETKEYVILCRLMQN